jgi:hypothetical protein
MAQAGKGGQIFIGYGPGGQAQIDPDDPRVPTLTLNDDLGMKPVRVAGSDFGIGKGLRKGALG